MVRWRYEELDCAASATVFKERIRSTVFGELKKKHSAERAVTTVLGEYEVTNESWDDARRIALDLVAEFRAQRFKR